MSTHKFNDSEVIREEFQKFFDLTPKEEIEYRAEMLSFIFLSEAEKAMERKGWTRKKLASEIGTSSSYLTQLFRGDRLLNLKTVAKIERALSLQYQIIDKSSDNNEEDGRSAERLKRMTGI